MGQYITCIKTSKYGMTSGIGKTLYQIGMVFNTKAQTKVNSLVYPYIPVQHWFKLKSLGHGLLQLSWYPSFWMDERDHGKIHGPCFKGILFLVFNLDQRRKTNDFLNNLFVLLWFSSYPLFCSQNMNIVKLKLFFIIFCYNI